jgi:hypothetical protein
MLVLVPTEVKSIAPLHASARTDRSKEYRSTSC